MPSIEVLEIPLLSGVCFPDWSVVTSEKVRFSLNDTLGRLRMTKRWGGMTEDEDIVRRAILNHYVEHGHSPTDEELASTTGLNVSGVQVTLSSLQERDLIVLTEHDQSVYTAYPFTNRNTEHRVGIGAVALNAMCAIDALGVGAMLDRNTEISSQCRMCGCEIQITTTDNGRSVASVSPETAIVWSGVQDIDGCAADTQCTVMAYFCSDDHLASWRAETNTGSLGHRLSIEQGLEAGAAIFIPFLAAGKPA